MPEGAEVRIIAEGLASATVGRPLLDINWDERSRFFPRGPPGLELIEPGAIVHRVLVKGKRILLDLGGLYMVSFLGMTGRWSLYREKHSNLSIVLGAFCSPPVVDDALSPLELKVTPILTRETNFRIFYTDTRHHGTLEIVSDPSAILSGIGPDLLGEEVDFSTYRHRVSLAGSKYLGSFLLEQKLLSGVGNYLKSEIMYRARLAPYLMVKELDEEELSRLRQVSIATLREAYDYGGYSFSDYLNFFGEKGCFQGQIYGWDRDPEGRSVIRDTFTRGDRGSTYWVPDVQRPDWLGDDNIKARLEYLRVKK